MVGFGLRNASIVATKAANQDGFRHQISDKLLDVQTLAEVRPPTAYTWCR